MQGSVEKELFSDKYLQGSRERGREGQFVSGPQGVRGLLIEDF